MALQYDSPQSGALRQGEILRDIWEHLPQYPPIESQPNQSFPVDSTHHKLVVIMSPDCDLEWDFKERFPNAQSQIELRTLEGVGESSKEIPYIFLAKLFLTEEIRSRGVNSSKWSRIQTNQEERYHHLKEASIGESGADQLPDLYIDFKKALAFPTQKLYEGFSVDGVKRVALIPDGYIHHLMHRYFGYLSRVALPE